MASTNRTRTQTLRPLALASLLLMAGIASAQAPSAADAQMAPTAKTASAPRTFDVATIRPSAPMDMAKLGAQMQAGKMPRFGPHVDGARAEFTYMSLKDLIAYAYKIKAYQVTGPDWLNAQRFDIVASLPDGTSKDDAPAMLQSLLADRFKLTAHRDTQEHPVLGLVVAKGGPKLKPSTEEPKPIDPDAPLKPGEMKIDGPDGPIRITRNPDGTMTQNMGAKGIFHMKMEGGMMHMDASSLTMAGLAEMLTSMMQMGGSGGRQVVDMTEIKGNYQLALDLSLADLMANARAQGMGGPGPGGPGGGGPPDPSGAVNASDPSGGTTMYTAVQPLGLKLEPRKAMVEQLIVDHAEKAPTDN